MLRGEGVSLGLATTAVPSSAAVTVTIPAGRLIESGHRAPALPVAEPVRTSGVELRPSRRKRLVASSSSEGSASPSFEEEEEEEEEGEMLRQHGQRYAAEDLSAATFGDIGGEVWDPPQAVAATPLAVTSGTPAPNAETVRAAATEATQSAAAEVASALPPTTIVMGDSPSDHATRAGGRAR
ncbi:hypothetical protein AAC387_Pa01g2663 [Persea americana]